VLHISSEQAQKFGLSSDVLDERCVEDYDDDDAEGGMKMEIGSDDGADEMDDFGAGVTSNFY
jgi:hypothetical protein